MAGWDDFSGGGGGSGGSSSSGGGVGWADLTTPKKKKSNDGGGFIGGLLHHLPKLGVSNLVHEVADIPYGLAALATGKGGYGRAWSSAGKNIAAATLGTFGRIGEDAGQIATLGQFDKLTGHNDVGASIGGWLGSSPEQKAQLAQTARGNYKEGLLPGLVGDIGSVSLVGAPIAKVAAIGDVGKVAAASEAAETAARVGFTTEDVANAADKLREAGSLKNADIGNKVLRAAAKAAVKADGAVADEASIAARARLLHAAETLAHPYQSIGHTLRAGTAAAQAAQLAGEVAPEAAPLTEEAARAAASQGLTDVADSAPDAALARTRALLGAAGGDAAGDAPAAITPDEQIAKLTEMLPKTEAPVIADAVKSGDYGPIEDAVRRAAVQPVSETAGKVVSKLPTVAQHVLAKGERLIEGHQTKNVVFERMRAQLADRNKIMASEPVQAGIKDASRFLVGKVMEDGTKIGPDMADRLLGDEVMARLSGVKDLEAEAVRAAPDAAGAIRKALVESGNRAAESIPADIASDPGFEAAMQHLTQNWSDAAGTRLERLTSSRLGDQGLEHVGEDVPQMTRSQKAELAAIRKLEGKLGTLGKKETGERARVEKLIARHEATSADLTERIKRAVQGHQEAAPAAFEQARGAEITPGRSLAQEAQSALPGAAEKTPHEVYRAGVVSGRQIEKAAKFGETADELIRRKTQLDKQVADLKRAMVEYKLPGQVARLRAEGAIARRVDRLGSALDDPSLVRTPAEWQPVYAALKDLHDAAVTNPALAKAVEGLPEKFSTVLDLAARRGFDPAHIRSFEPGQVRQLVYGQVRLGKQGIELGKTIEAGTRKARLVGQTKTRSLSALAGAMVEATHEDNTNALATFIEDTWAKDVPADGPPSGWAPWDAAKRHLLTGESTSPGVQVRGATASKMIPVEVKRTLDSFSKDYNHPVFKAVRRVTNPWKALVLTLNPGWYVNHFVGHVVGAAKEGTNVSDWASAWREYRRGGESLGSNRVVGKLGRGEDAFGGLPEVEKQSFVSDMDRPQMIPFPHGTEGLKLAKQTSGTRSAIRLFMDRYRAPIKTIDDISRAAVYNAAKRGGASSAEALQRATEAFLDYQRMGPFEQQIVNSVVPFYSFEKAMMRVVAKMPLDHPVATGFLMTLSGLNQQINENIYGTGLPEYYRNLMHLPGLGTVNFEKFNPFASAATSLSSPQAIAGSINPFISAIVRNAYGAPDYFPHNAQGQLVAPNTRLDEFGNEVPATDLTSDLTSSFSGVPLARLIGAATQSSAITGQQPAERGVGVAKFFGAPVMTQDQVQKLLARVIAYQTAQRKAAARR